jgi:hypothetical protein
MHTWVAIIVFYIGYLFYTPAALAQANKAISSKQFSIQSAALKNKIKGGWAGQTIGVTFGGPVEFRFNGTMIGDQQRLEWYDGYLKKAMTENPGLYDDLYMDLTFVEVMEKYGIDAPLDSFANAYAKAGYMLWHANQAGRYNILNGIKSPASGHWLNNPHADDIDYQIEADFAGLMSPGMPNTATAISDKIGHIMNYGDGWYGGVFMGAMYSMAFISDNIPAIVEAGLKTIPQQSEFYKCIRDVINWHKKYPNDWKQTWFEVQKKWSEEVGCPDGVFNAFNIDAKINSAYVVIGLLYGNGDFTKTVEIAARCGQDADCNPSSAAGILGTVLGYDKIPAYWKLGLAEIEDMDFKYTSMSLNDTYTTGFKHALEVIQKNGGTVSGDKITIAVQTPEATRFEKSFEGHYPVKRETVKQQHNEMSFEFDGIGYVLRGAVDTKDSKNKNSSFAFEAEIYIDGKLSEKVLLPASEILRRHELSWKYQLPEGHHKVTLKVLNQQDGFTLRAWEALIYGANPPSAFSISESVKTK